MSAKFVQVAFDIDCTWDSTTPIYRVYVNRELFTERTWIWRNEYLEEMLQISAEPGKYSISFELVDPESGAITVTNPRVIQGAARIYPNHTLVIFE